MHGFGGGGFGGGGFGGGFGGGGGGGKGGKGGGGKGLPKPGIVTPSSIGTAKRPGSKKPKGVFPGGKVDAHVVTGSGDSGGFGDATPAMGLPPGPTESLAREPMVHVVVFAKYANENGKRLLDDVGFLDAASRDRFHMILVGYSDSKPKPAADARPLSAPIRVKVGPVKWYYDPAEFVRQMDVVQDNTTWTYEGGLQLLILDVPVANRHPATMEEMFENKKAELRHVITVGVEELKEKGLIRDFDALFQKLRKYIPGKGAPSERGPTFQLSDSLGISATGQVTKVIAKAFEMKWTDALDEALKFKHFAVRDISR